MAYRCSACGGENHNSKGCPKRKMALGEPVATMARSGRAGWNDAADRLAAIGTTPVPSVAPAEVKFSKDAGPTAATLERRAVDLLTDLAAVDTSVWRQPAPPVDRERGRRLDANHGQAVILAKFILAYATELRAWLQSERRAA